MPYIEKIFRESARKTPIGAGELDYNITMTILEYLQNEGWNFSNMNLIVGVLENVKDEFQRRVMYPHEDKKCQLNGDVYPEFPR